MRLIGLMKLMRLYPVECFPGPEPAVGSHAAVRSDKVHAPLVVLGEEVIVVRNLTLSTSTSRSLIFTSILFLPQLENT